MTVMEFLKNVGDITRELKIVFADPKKGTALRANIKKLRDQFRGSAPAWARLLDELEAMVVEAG